MTISRVDIERDGFVGSNCECKSITVVIENPSEKVVDKFMGALYSQDDINIKVKKLEQGKGIDVFGEETNRALKEYAKKLDEEIAKR